MAFVECKKKKKKKRRSRFLCATCEDLREKLSVKKPFYFLHQFLRSCQINLFTGVHDSFWTHACDVDKMNQILREKFVELYSKPILENVSISWPRLTREIVNWKLSWACICYVIISGSLRSPPQRKSFAGENKWIYKFHFFSNLTRMLRVLWLIPMLGENLQPFLLWLYY